VIACVTVTTAARQWCLALAVEAFRRQTYDDAFLLVYSTLEPPPRVEADGVRVIHRHRESCAPLSLGGKRNEAIVLARQVHRDVAAVVSWDDDDYSHPRRLEVIAAQLDRGAEVVGSTSLVFADLATGRRMLYRYQGSRPYLVGGSAAFTVERWRQVGGYPESKRAEDTRLLWKLCAAVGPERVGAIDDLSLYVPTRHGGNTGKVTARAPAWTPFGGQLDDQADAGVAALAEAWRRRG
jgi:hypothetical protein